MLHVDLDLEAIPPDANAPGWSAGARGNWRLERDGQTLAGERFASRSRTEFAYGAPLGIGASEVIDAIAVRIGMTLGVNALLADGSVRFVKSTINFNIYQALSTRAQGEIISSDAY